MLNFFDRYEPDGAELLRCISDHIDDEMLMEIALADRGPSWGTNLEYIRNVRNLGYLTLPMGWYPREALEIVSWLEPDDPEPRPGEAGERGHWKRAFACATLLRAAADAFHCDNQQGWNQSLMQLISSLRAVGHGLEKPGAALLAYIIRRLEGERNFDELGFFMVGLLWFSLSVTPAIADDTIIGLCERISAEASQMEEFWPSRTKRWLLGTSVFDRRHDDWEMLGRALLDLDLSERGTSAREWVSLIGSSLAGAGSGMDHE